MFFCNESLLSVSGYKVQRAQRYEQSHDEFEFEQGVLILNEDNEERTAMAVERLQVGSITKILNKLFSCLVQKQIKSFFFLNFLRHQGVNVKIY